MEGHWTKRDTFIPMGCDTAQYAETKQLEAAFSLWRKTAFSMKFAQEWLSCAQDERIITDMPNQGGKENYPGFRGQRHDQSVWSILCKKHQLKSHRLELGFIFHFRTRIKKYGYFFCLMHPMRLRLNFLILREVHPALGRLSPLIQGLRKAVLASLKCLIPKKRRSAR